MIIGQNRDASLKGQVVEMACPRHTVAAQARAIDRIFEILIVGAKPRHSGQAAGAKQ